MKQIVIIGAGPAGLSAASALLDSGNRDIAVTILEESGAIGGISRTVQHNGNRMDLGGHRFFSKCKEVTDFWQTTMPLQGAPSMDYRQLGRTVPLAKGGPDPEIEDKTMLVRNRVSRIFFRHKFFDYPISMKPQTIKNMGLGTTVQAGFSYLGSCIHKLPEDSLENFYINRFGRKLYSMFFEGYTEKLWGRHPREISADWGAQRVKGLSIVSILRDMWKKVFPGKSDGHVETSLIEEFWYPKYGPGQLWETVAANVQQKGAVLRMNAKVVGIENGDDGSIHAVTVECEGKMQRIAGDVFISSMPIKDLVADMQNVPASIAHIAEGLPYRDFVTVGLLVDKLSLKNETNIKTLNNIVPDCWIYVQDTGVKLGRIQIFNNWSPYMVKDPLHTVWIGLEYFCSEGDAFWSMDEAACVQYARKELVSMGVLDADTEIHDSHREHIKKAYPAYFDTYSEIDTLIAYLDGYKNLFCVGRNGQHRYNNMDHSMMTAFEAAKDILAGKTDRSNVWHVNTEKEYHEEKDA